jgi:hypothetical protein
VTCTSIVLGTLPFSTPAIGSGRFSGRIGVAADAAPGASIPHDNPTTATTRQARRMNADSSTRAEPRQVMPQ